MCLHFLKNVTDDGRNVAFVVFSAGFSSWTCRIFFECFLLLLMVIFMCSEGQNLVLVFWIVFPFIRFEVLRRLHKKVSSLRLCKYNLSVIVQVHFEETFTYITCTCCISKGGKARNILKSQKRPKPNEIDFTFTAILFWCKIYYFILYFCTINICLKTICTLSSNMVILFWS